MRKKELEEESTNLEKLKEEYEKLNKIYNLPKFDELNKLFDIEEVLTDTDLLLRKIRRTISEKINGYLRFVELVLNPSSAPLFFFNLVKKLDYNDKEILSIIYETLGNMETDVIALDLEYSEKKEADFINKSFEAFNSQIKKDLLKITEKFSNRTNNNLKKNNGSYLG